MAAFRELLLFRLRETVRRPEPLVWGLLFPMVLSGVLAFAFSDRQGEAIPVAVVEAQGAAKLAEALSSREGLAARVVSQEELDRSVRRGEMLVAVVPGEPPTIVYNNELSSSRTAQHRVEDALERLAGREDRVNPKLSSIGGGGRRYVDFLIPGILGFVLLNSTIAAVGFPLVNMRRARVLKRLRATPLGRVQFLLSFVVMRGLFSALQIAFFVLLGMLFGVQIQGSIAAIFFFGIVAAMSWSGMAFLVASRTDDPSVAGSLDNLIMLPMLLVSGVFFSAANYSGWLQTVIRALPLTLLIDGLRALFSEGASLGSLIGTLAALIAWGVVSFALALRLFRWS